jgi:ArsR family transcriptional regulator, arsenate/arsenite/antimonite-responsive transcriptional repressor / arsenate reductase (thioredoxin)
MMPDTSSGSTAPRRPPLRVLFLCTHNTVRSQIAEALLARKGDGRFVEASAGSDPAAETHPLTVDTLAARGIDWTGRRPKGIDALLIRGQRWDAIITFASRSSARSQRIASRPPTTCADRPAR